MEQPTALLIIDLFSLFDFPQGRQLAPCAVHAAQRTPACVLHSTRTARR